MKKLLIYPILALILAVGVNIQGASATLLGNGTIFLSGDCSFIERLTTQDPVPNGSTKTVLPDPGNQQFFLNILQGGNKVVVLDNKLWKEEVWSLDKFGETIDGFYDKHGMISDLITGPVATQTNNLLAGVDLFVAPLLDHSFTSYEISAINGLLARGGTVFFLGENQFPEKPYYTRVYNENINAALAALGSRLSIVMDGKTFDDQFTDENNVPQYWNAKIATDPFTAGVESFTYASPSQVSGGTPIFFGTDDSERRPRPIVAYEVVPVPPSAWLLGSGLLGLGFFRRRYRG